MYCILNTIVLTMKETNGNQASKRFVDGSEEELRSKRVQKVCIRGKASGLLVYVQEERKNVFNACSEIRSGRFPQDACKRNQSRGRTGSKRHRFSEIFERMRERQKIRVNSSAQKIRKLELQVAFLTNDNRFLQLALHAAEREKLQAAADEKEAREQFLRERAQRKELELRLREEMQRSFELQKRIEKFTENQPTLDETLEENRRLFEQLSDALKKLKKLEKKLNIRKGTEDPYGLSTPSSRKVAKANSSEENQKKKGGAVPGHEGHGRTYFKKEEADEIRKNTAIPKSPCCGNPEYEAVDFKVNSYIDFVPAKMKIIYEENKIYQCRHCGKQIEAVSPDALSKAKYSNAAVGILINEAFGNLMPYGMIAERYNINKGTLIGIFHRTAELVEPVFQAIRESIKNNPVVHGDETPWSVDGKRAYTWLFAAEKVRLYLFRNTRAASVPKEVFPDSDLLDLVLVTDRYGGYNSLPVQHQYCFVHLLRDLVNLAVDFPDDPEVKKFVADLKTPLKEAIGLRSKGLSEKSYRKTASKLKKRIMQICNTSANHPGIQSYQDIFRNGEKRLFQWTESSDIPCENNFAERNLRPVVIARKMSFGCQSDQGMRTREILMSIVQTIKCLGLDPAAFIRKVLDSKCADPEAPPLDIFNEFCSPSLESTA